MEQFINDGKTKPAPNQVFFVDASSHVYVISKVTEESIEYYSISCYGLQLKHTSTILAFVISKCGSYGRCAHRFQNEEDDMMKIIEDLKAVESFEQYLLLKKLEDV